MQFLFPKPSMPRSDQVLPGRPEAIVQPAPHVVNGHSLTPPYPEGSRSPTSRMGCFWGAEKEFWSDPGRLGHGRRLPGRHDAQPDLQRGCTGRPAMPRPCGWCTTRRSSPTSSCSRLFWEDHDPTQGFRQGNDVGTAVPLRDLHPRPRPARRGEASRDMYAAELTKAGYGAITTEIREAPAFYFAEDYHQQYLVKVPNGYCPNHATGVKLPDKGSPAPPAGVRCQLAVDMGLRRDRRDRARRIRRSDFEAATVGHRDGLFLQGDFLQTAFRPRPFETASADVAAVDGRPDRGSVDTLGQGHRIGLAYDHARLSEAVARAGSGAGSRLRSWGRPQGPCSGSSARPCSGP